MGLSQADLVLSLDELASRDPVLAAVLADVGYPPSRSRPKGYETLLRTIVGQQVSVHAAAAMWRRLEELIGVDAPPEVLIDHTDEQLRACGLSRQKIRYARSLAGLVAGGEIDLNSLPDGDEDAIARLVQIDGIGRWSAEIYLLFAEGRRDIWPAGDLAVQVQVGRWTGMRERPGEATVRAVAEEWRPHRGAVAILAWHNYNSVVI